MANAYYNLGVLLVNRGSTAEAIAEFRATLKCEPKQANAHYNLALCLERQGKYAEAMVSWRAALRIEPNNVDTVDEVAWRLATSADASLRDGRQAIELARQAVRLSNGEAPRPLSTLAAAYAEAGQFAEAVKTAQRAIDLAARRGDAAAAADLRARSSATEPMLRITSGPVHRSRGKNAVSGRQSPKRTAPFRRTDLEIRPGRLDGSGNPSCGQLSTFFSYRPSKSDLAHGAATSGATLGSQSGTSLDFARFFVVFAATHLFLDSAPLDQLAEATHRFLYRLPFPQRQFDHSFLLRVKMTMPKPLRATFRPPTGRNNVL